MEDQKPILKKELLGEILIKRNMITPEQLTQALELQKKEGGYVGEILVKLGLLEERDVVVALIVQCSLPYIAVNKYEIDRQIIQLIPEDLARRHLLIPLDRVGKVLSVVMANPLDEAVKNQLQDMTQLKVVPFIATKAEIKEAIDRWYSKS